MTYTLHELQSLLPFFIEAEFRKKKDKGAAILHISLFLDWVKKNVKQTKP